MLHYIWLMFTFSLSNAELWKSCESVCAANLSYSTANVLVQNATCQVEKQCDEQELYNSHKIRNCYGGKPSDKMVEVYHSERSKVHLNTLQIHENNNEYILELLWDFRVLKAHSVGKLSSEWILKFGVFFQSENFSTCYSIKFYNESLQYIQDFFSFCIEIPSHVVSSPLHFNVISHIEEDSGNLVSSLPALLQDLDVEMKTISSGIPLKVWRANISYLIIGNILSIAFAPEPSYDHKTYDLDVYETTENCDSALGKSLVHDRIEAEWPITTKNVTTKFERCHNYLITVSYSHESSRAECSVGCFSRSVASTCLRIPVDFWNNQEAYCNDWNGTFYDHPSKGKDIIFEFKVDCCRFDMCCDILKILLVKVRNDDCNNVIARINEENFKMDKNGNTIIFRNVPGTGSYCAKVTSRNISCTNKMKPRYLNSRIVTPDSKPTQIYSLAQNHTDESLIAVVIPTVSVVLVVLIISVLTGIFCWKRKPPDCDPGDKTEMLVYEHFSPLSVIQNMAKKITVVVLYTHDSTTKKRVRVLAKFLCDFLKFNVVYDDNQLPLVAINEEAWMTGLLNYGCKEMGDESTTCNTNKKIIIVESDQAVKHQKHQQDILKNMQPASGSSKKPVKCLVPRQNDELENFDKLLERLFIFGFSIIASNMKKRLEDYCHLFVVRFPDTSIECRLEQLVPNKRYKIPDHLTELCLDLSEVSTDIKKDELTSILEDKWNKEMTEHF